MELAEFFAGQVDREAPITRRVIERVPDNIASGWKPHPKSMEFGYLSSLVAGMFGWISMMVTTEFLDLGAGGGGPHATSTAERLALLDKSVADAKRALEGTTDDDLKKAWQLRVSGRVVDEKPRFMQIADTFTHLAHHRGQLTVYLRLNDVAIPSVYGPTADERW